MHSMSGSWFNSTYRINCRRGLQSSVKGTVGNLKLRGSWNGEDVYDESHLRSNKVCISKAVNQLLENQVGQLIDRTEAVFLWPATTPGDRIGPHLYGQVWNKYRNRKYPLEIRCAFSTSKTAGSLSDSRHADISECKSAWLPCRFLKHIHME